MDSKLRNISHHEAFAEVQVRVGSFPTRCTFLECHRTLFLHFSVFAEGHCCLHLHENFVVNGESSRRIGFSSITRRGQDEHIAGRCSDVSTHLGEFILPRKSNASSVWHLVAWRNGLLDNRSRLNASHLCVLLRVVIAGFIPPLIKQFSIETHNDTQPTKKQTTVNKDSPLQPKLILNMKILQLIVPFLTVVAASGEQNEACRLRHFETIDTSHNQFVSCRE